MMHSEREARLLVRVARLHRDAERMAADLSAAGMDATKHHVLLAVISLGKARETAMSAIREQDEAAGRKP